MLPNQRKPWPLVLPDLTLNGVPLPVVDECKLLGVYINNGLNWNSHVTHLLAKASKCLFVIIQAKKFQFSTHTIITLYQWFIRTSLEYAAPVWHPGLTQRQHDMLERVQKRVLRIILWPNYPGYEAALAQLNLSSLRERREQLTLRLGMSILRSPQHRGLLPPTLGEVHGRNTRHHQRLQPVRCRTEKRKKSSVPYVVTLINEHVHING